MRPAILALFLLFPLGSWSQSSCGIRAPFRQLTTSLRTDSVLPAGTITIPVVVHILWHQSSENVSDATVLSQIEALNRDYQGNVDGQQYIPSEFQDLIGDPDLNFCLAARDPLGLPTTGIERRYTPQPEFGASQDWYSSLRGGCDAWEPDQYLNIWVVNTGDFVTGFASYPAQNLPYDGVVVHPKYFGINDHRHYGLGRVATHEVGHFLGLLHPWADDNDCLTDDGIADTPPQHASHGGCPSYPAMGCADSEMFMNFMDYVDDPCMLLFTHGQAASMRQTLATQRPQLGRLNMDCLQPSHLPFTMVPYPNPSQGKITVLFNTPPMKLIEYHLTNAAGQSILHGNQLINDKLYLECTALAPGLYILHTEGASTRILIQ